MPDTSFAVSRHTYQADGCSIERVHEEGEAKAAPAYLRPSSEERAAGKQGRRGTSFTVEVSDSEGSARGEEGDMTLDRYDATK